MQMNRFCVNVAAMLQIPMRLVQPFDFAKNKQPSVSSFSSVILDNLLLQGGSK